MPSERARALQYAQRHDATRCGRMVPGCNGCNAGERRNRDVARETTGADYNCVVSTASCRFGRRATRRVAAFTHVAACWWSWTLLDRGCNGQRARCR